MDPCLWVAWMMEGHWIGGMRALRLRGSLPGMRGFNLCHPRSVRARCMLERGFRSSERALILVLQAVLTSVYRLPKRSHLGYWAFRGPLRERGPRMAQGEVLGPSGPPLGYASDSMWFLGLPRISNLRCLQLLTPKWLTFTLAPNRISPWPPCQMPSDRREWVTGARRLRAELGRRPPGQRAPAAAQWGFFRFSLN